jgi:hypothetical protein
MRGGERWWRDLLCTLGGVLVGAGALVPVGWVHLRAERQRAEEALRAERQRAEAAEAARRDTAQFDELLAVGRALNAHDPALSAQIISRVKAELQMELVVRELREARKKTTGSRP